MAQLAALFNDNPLIGGEVAPRTHKWVNDKVSIFVRFDRPNSPEATALRYIGIGVVGEFCKSKHPHLRQPQLNLLGISGVREVALRIQVVLDRLLSRAPIDALA